MDEIFYNSNSISEYSASIYEISNKYREAGTTFIREVELACEGWDGYSREKFMTFLHEVVQKNLCEDIPQCVETMAVLMKQVGDTFENVDNTIAGQIPEELFKEFRN